MTKRTGKLILQNDFNSSFLFYPKTEEEKNSFSWANEDYRQSKVAASIEGAVSKPEEYLPFYFRHLSATIVGAYSWKATEFSEAVLKKAASKLTHKPAYVNHELEIGNIVGVNGQIQFAKSKKLEDGTTIPGGLEGPIWVDARLHQDLCRKLTGYPVPHIQSVSVTVTYNWEPSHEFTDRSGEVDEWEFERRVGTMVDGRMVRRVVTEIVDFYETSFVYLGADPFAKILDADGNILNIEKESIVGDSSFDKDALSEMYKKDNVMIIKNSELDSENILNLKKSFASNFSKSGNFGKDDEKEKQKLSKEEEMEQKLIAAFAKLTGKKEEEITPELIEGYSVVTKEELDSYKAAKADLDGKETEVTKLEGELADAKGTVDKFTKICSVEEIEDFEKEVDFSQVRKMAKFGSDVFAAKREECVRLYKLSVGEGKESQAVIDTINKSDKDALEGFLTQYGTSLHETFGAKCKECGSEEVSFRTSKEEEGEGDSGEVMQRPRMAETFRQ